MPTPVAMPKLGFSMERGTVVQWLKSAGDPVECGEAVVLIHSEKVEYEVEAQSSGKLLHILIEPGIECAPGDLLGVIGNDGEDVEVFLRNHQSTEVPGEVRTEPAALSRTSVDPPRADASDVRASPRARKIAAEKKLDLTRVASELPGKRITEGDVLQFLERHGVGSSAASHVLERIPIAGIRGEIAGRMITSWHNAPMVALSTSADFSVLEQRRQQLQLGGYQDIIMRATALELRANPRLNSTVQDGNIEIYEPVNIGFAVSLDTGLIVPVIHNADRKSVAEIGSERAALVEAARDGRLKRDDVTGATFTLSSLGSYGVTVFTPILNPPQTGILGIGAVERVAAVVADRIEVRPRVTLTLVFDHRAIDGAPAAGFLKAIRERLEQGHLD